MTNELGRRIDQNTSIPAKEMEKRRKWNQAATSLTSKPVKIDRLLLFAAPVGFYWTLLINCVKGKFGLLDAKARSSLTLCAEYSFN